MLRKTERLEADGSPWKPSATLMRMIDLLAKNDKLVRNYSRIGQQLPGVPRQPRGDFQWVPTGQFHEIKMRRGLNGNGKPAVYRSPVYTLLPTQRKFMHEMRWRITKVPA